MPVAYSYIRFSTTEQKKGDSLRRQSELSEQYAEEHGLTLDSSLHLQDLGLSAFDRSNIERGALGAFLEAINKGRIAPGSYLLVESLDRLSRDKVLAALELFISILRQGITIVTLADRMVYNTELVGNNFGNLIISITIMARAHEESAMKSRRILAAWEGKRARIGEKKLTAQCPRWLRLNDDKTEFEFVPERAALVIEILAWHKAGMGQALIAKRLNERNEKPFSNHGNGWHSSYIQKIINSPALYGEFQPHLWNKGAFAPQGDPIADYYPALISREEFNLLKYLRSERSFPGARARKGTDVPNLLSGIAKCGYCGSTMILAGGAAQRVRSEEGGLITRPAKKVLVCDGARRGLGCYAVQWEYKEFETSFLSFCKTIELSSLLVDSETLELEQKRELTVGERLKSVIVAIDSCDQRLEKLLAALETGEVSTAVVQRIRKVEEERDSLVDSRFGLEAELNALAITGRHLAYQAESVQHAIQRLDSLSGDERFTTRSMLAEHIRHLIQVVYVHPAGRLVGPEFLERKRINLLEAGFDESRVDMFLSTTYRTEPLRTGRGVRGRYVSRKDVGRFFVIKAKKGGLRVIYPDFNNPAEVRVALGDA